MSKQKSVTIRTGTELVNSPVPEIPYRILGLLRAKGGRMSITGQYKMMKSFLAHDLALRICSGQDWLGYKTIPSNVLYINLEISEEKFQERTQDIQGVCKYEENSLSRFRELTILDTNLSLDKNEETVQQLLDNCRKDGFPVHALILDPRARVISGSENEEKVIKQFCDNVDRLLLNNKRLSVIIVTHMGKDSSKGAIGHSRYSGWLDTEIKISKNYREPKIKTIEIVGRDTEDMKINLEFNYPLHNIVVEEEFARKSKVSMAKAFILHALENGPMTEQNLEREARFKNISDYAFHAAIRELRDSGKIELPQAGGQGNRKTIQLVK